MNSFDGSWSVRSELVIYTSSPESNRNRKQKSPSELIGYKSELFEIENQ